MLLSPCTLYNQLWITVHILTLHDVLILCGLPYTVYIILHVYTELYGKKYQICLYYIFMRLAKSGVKRETFAKIRQYPFLQDRIIYVEPLYVERGLLVARKFFCGPVLMLKLFYIEKKKFLQNRKVLTYSKFWKMCAAKMYFSWYCPFNQWRGVLWCAEPCILTYIYV